MIDQIIDFNRTFVDTKGYEKYITDKYPDKKLAVLSCMDTIGEPFDWLYIDANTLKEKAAKNGYVVEVVAEGEHYDYLARIAKKIC